MASGLCNMGSSSLYRSVTKIRDDILSTVERPRGEIHGHVRSFAVFLEVLGGLVWSCQVLCGLFGGILRSCAVLWGTLRCLVLPRVYCSDLVFYVRKNAGSDLNRDSNVHRMLLNKIGTAVYSSFPNIPIKPVLLTTTPTFRYGHFVYAQTRDTAAVSLVPATRTSNPLRLAS